MAFRIGTNGSETIDGTDEADILSGLGGNDRLIGHAGDDILLGGRGDDILLGQAGLDLLYGGDGNDTLDGWGVTRSSGEGGDDTLIWNTGAAQVTAGLSEENLFDGGVGNDTMIIVNNATETFQSVPEEPAVEPAVTVLRLNGMMSRALVTAPRSLRSGIWRSMKRLRSGDMLMTSRPSICAATGRSIMATAAGIPCWGRQTATDCSAVAVAMCLMAVAAMTTSWMAARR